MALNTPNLSPAYRSLFKVTLRQMFWSRRTILILVGCLLSLAIALGFRFVARGSGSVNGFIPNITLALYGLLVNLSAIFYGTAIISDEIDGKGLTYLQMRPIRKSRILLSKFSAYFIGTLTLIGTSHLLMTGIMLTHPKLQNGVLFQLGMSLRYIGIIALGLLAYGALATFLATRFKNPVLWGLVYVMGWESITTMPLMAPIIKRLSISHYLFVLFPSYKLPRSEFNFLLGTSPPSAVTALITTCVLTAGLLWLAIRTFREREYLM